MLPRWGRNVTYLSNVYIQSIVRCKTDRYIVYRNYSKVSPAAKTSMPEHHDKPEVNLNKLFWSKPCSLALAPDSPLRVEEPKFVGFKYYMLKLLLFYSKQSKALRGANTVYWRVVSQVDQPDIYNVFNLEKTFKTTFSLLVVHMWLYLRRLKEEGQEGSNFGQHVYEIYNHDMELRASKAGVNLLLSRHMKNLERIFYGNIVAYDAALLPEAKQGELHNVIWRNVFSDDGSPMPSDASFVVQAMARYVRRESTCLSLTDKEALYSGNFVFTPLVNLPSPDLAKRIPKKK